MRVEPSPVTESPVGLYGWRSGHRPAGRRWCARPSRGSGDDIARSQPGVSTAHDSCDAGRSDSRRVIPVDRVEDHYQRRHHTAGEFPPAVTPPRVEDALICRVSWSLAGTMITPSDVGLLSISTRAMGLLPFQPTPTQFPSVSHDRRFHWQSGGPSRPSPIRL